MYTVKCDNYPLLDVRDDSLMIYNPNVKLKTNTVGEGSFTIYDKHPYYGKLNMLKSVFEVADEIGVIFRGRMTDNTIDFDNGKAVDLEGAMAFFNDSLIEPYSFPDDFLDNEDYISAAGGGNVVEFFLGWLVEQHNSQVDEPQRFKLGNVTVSDPNNYISRSNENYVKTWNEIKEKLFDSTLGGYLCIRYEADGNYIDYLKEFEYVNTQSIKFGENLIDMLDETDGKETCSAVMPLGAEVEEDGATTKKRLTIKNLPDGEITDDIVKEGKIIYSKSARESYGMILANPEDTTWDDVTDAYHLQTKGVSWLSTTGCMLKGNIEFNAYDLHYTDAEIQSFRIYRKVKVILDERELPLLYDLTELNIPLLQPQDMKIAVGNTKKTLTQNLKNQTSSTGKDGKDGEDATTVRIDSSRGTVFKNILVSTVLSAVIY